MLRKMSQMEIGEQGVVKHVLGEGRIRRRLFDMGVTPGANVSIRKRAPLGDPIEVSIRGYELSLRKEEAEFIEVEVKED